jgi:hypothetical protein
MKRSASAQSLAEASADIASAAVTPKRLKAAAIAAGKGIGVPRAVSFAALALDAPTGQKIRCGMCGTGPPYKPFPQVVNEKGQMVPAGTACMAHWKVFCRALLPLGHSWSESCANYHDER